MTKRPQINASVYTGRLGHPRPEDIPGLLDLLAQITSAIPDLTRPIECRPASTEPVYRIMLEARVTSVTQLADYARRIAQYIQFRLDCADKRTDILNCVDGGCL